MTYRISDRIKEIATPSIAQQFAVAADPRAFCIEAMGILPSHPHADHWISKAMAAFNKLNGKTTKVPARQSKGHSSASYTLKQCQSTGTYWAETEVKWDRKFGKCDRRTMAKHNTVYTRSALKQWGKRNGVVVDAADLHKMPSEV